ncbi:dynein, cytoplasmic 1, intermediate chain 2a isoform X1 [Ictalurus furcatus]|uniref:dynein, cytoplasmic 1, intermediate chain 2a isoform X1 n=1 Tax=Ictalurus furcatus TaxID=66913 RepID=UPI002350E31C|nr:dynein, cytoplasmic 1, intermediate chain 2a isoform X1 [Ictalurus furcatus]XP_053492045.1 dynein, cytoplasmic 1, intermediate chain 2a isoform X1 [Ictalurus furcatus]XP_053492046.1 dynein, cytoplasmic 1, intermediate chain 2a isoform X1 [Ictalurus furcatus]XP_053492047.1 dynein, cytoplasmic 1, intermediate chain 2a isoform X1 [Ictalurus furcatus]XP_053492048.1 dynein, cytoplasmic 1, intermediate chain 2a isoform X1 [Ictalurus furcatus]
MSEKSELKAELERKKQRLAQIREEKKRKEEERKKKETEGRGEGASPPNDDSDLERKRRETEALLQSMGITDPAMVPPPMSPSAKSVGTPSETGSQDSADGATGARTLHWDSDPSTLLLHSDSQHGRGPLRLGMAKVTQVDFPPRELVSYSKETQTPVTTQPKDAEEENEEEDLAVDSTALESPKENEPHAEEEEAPPHELTEEEKQQILHSDDFQTFFDHSSRIMERALSEQVDVCFDYSGRDLQDKEGETQAGTKLSLNRQFIDERWSKHRVVTCLDWSPQYPELLVASYSSNEEAPHEPDGVALVWNMKYKKTTAEYVFHCQSAVMSAAFAQFHPNLVVGGTYSGQIVLWDNRSNKRTPVQRTPLSASAHTHPVYCVSVVGTQNAHNLISISTDGKMCSWSLDMLSTPHDSLELVFKQSKPVAVTSMAFPLGDVNNFVVGSEDGTVYTACRHGSKAGISEMFEGHHGPVTGLDCHTATGPVDFSHLFVTSSFDWTVKLWSTRNTKPLYSFEDNSDYVYDVMWSPAHPALFACVDGVGHLDLWNLNNETEVPSASVTIEGNPALNRVRWASSGREVAVGDSEGRVHIYDVGEQIAVPRQDEWTRFLKTLSELGENQEEAEDLATQRLAA